MKEKEEKQPEEDLEELFGEVEEETDYSKVIMQFFEPETFKTKTDLPKGKILNLALAHTYSSIIKKYSKEGSDLIEELLEKYYKLRVSNERKGRREAFDTLKRLQTSGEQENKGILSRLIHR
ncbi:MAG: hypothetical protein QW591_03305 [Candidatus Micrarchaeaceae archaeon]